jgi:hypothetical protein
VLVGTAAKQMALICFDVLMLIKIKGFLANQKLILNVDLLANFAPSSMTY